MDKKVDKSILILLFFFSTVFTTSFIGPSLLKLSPVRVIIICITLRLLFKIIINRGKIKISSIEGNLYPVVLLFSWVIYGIVLSCLVSVDFKISFNAIVYIIIGLILYLYFVEISIDERDLKKYFKVFVIGIAINNIIGWYEIMTNNYLFTLSVDNTEYFTRHGYAITFFANPNNLCTMLSMGSFVCWGLYLVEHYWIWKGLYLSVIMSSFMIMVRNVSESNIIAMIIGFVLWFLLLLKHKRRLQRENLLLLLFAVSVLLIVGFQYFPLLLEYIKTVVKSLFIQDSTLGQRILYARNAVTGMMYKNPLGVGAGNSIYYTLANGKIGNVHNWFIEILVDYGVLIFIGYIMIYVNQICAFYIIAFKKIESKESWVYAIFLILLITFLISNISSSTLFTYEFIWIIWILGFYLFNKVSSDRRTL